MHGACLQEWANSKGTLTEEARRQHVLNTHQPPCREIELPLSIKLGTSASFSCVLITRTFTKTVELAASRVILMQIYANDMGLSSENRNDAHCSEMY